MMRGPAAARAASEKVEVEPTESVLGRGARVRGRVGGEGDLRVEGQIEGDVRITGELSIEEGGAVAGDVEASAVTVGGTLTGDVGGKGAGSIAITIRATARVEGNLGNAEVVLEEGASFQGRIDAEFDLPGLEAAPSAKPAAARRR